MSKILYIVLLLISWAFSTNIVFAEPNKSQTFNFLKKKVMLYANYRSIVDSDGWCDMEFKEFKLKGNILSFQEKITGCHDGSGYDNTFSHTNMDLSKLDPTRVTLQFDGDNTSYISLNCTDNKKCINTLNYKKTGIVIGLKHNETQNQKILSAFKHLIKLSGGKGELF